MKKLSILLSMLMVVCMLGTVSVSAAVDWTTDAAITMVADSTSVKVGDEVVITVGIKGDTSGEIGMYGTAKVVPMWDVAAFEYVSSEVDSTTFELTASPAVATTTTASGYVTFSQKVGADDELPTGDYIFGTLTLKAIKEGTATISLRSSTSTKVTQVASPKATNTVELPETLTVDVEVKADEPIVPDEEVFEIIKTETAVAGTDTMKDENGADVAAAGDKVVAIFAKNISDAELEAGSYGIVFGGVRYAGQLAVPAKTAWAIKLVGSAEQLPAGNYAYGIFAGEATVDATTPWVID